jgi:hypothetical protein
LRASHRKELGDLFISVDFICVRVIVQTERSTIPVLAQPLRRLQEQLIVSDHLGR